MMFKPLVILLFLLSHCCGLQASDNEEFDRSPKASPHVLPHMEAIPAEILLEFARLLNISQLKIFRLVCKDWLVIGSDALLKITKAHYTQTTLKEEIAFTSLLAAITSVKIQAPMPQELLEEYIEKSTNLRDLTLSFNEHLPDYEKLEQLATTKSIKLHLKNFGIKTSQVSFAMPTDFFTLQGHFRQSNRSYVYFHYINIFNAI